MTTPAPDWKAAAAAASEARDDARRLAGGVSAFAAALYAELADGNANNVFYSPASLALSLAMAREGARGETAAEIGAALILPDLPADRLRTAFAALSSAPPADSGVELRVANALFAQIGEHWAPEFFKVLAERFDAPLRQINFQADAERAAHGINHWVRQQTKGRVDAIVDPGTLPPTTKLVLANAVYLRGLWSTPFTKKLTRDAPFQRRDGSRVPVPMMHQRGGYRMYQMAGVQILDLPYDSSPISMTVILPRNDAALPATGAEIATTLILLMAHLDRQPSREIDVFLPRFRLDMRTRFADALAKLGVVRAFDAQTADFSGMNGKPDDLFIGTVAHRAMIEVEEAGTVAAAATGLRVERLSAPVDQAEIPVFRADHPFLFVIRDSRTNNILFLGRVMDPRG